MAKKPTTFNQIHVSKVLNIEQKICHEDHQTSSRETTHWSPHSPKCLLSMHRSFQRFYHFNLCVLPAQHVPAHTYYHPPEARFNFMCFSSIPPYILLYKKFKKKQRICNMGFLNLVRRKESNKIRNMKVYSFDLKAGFEICKRNKNLGFSSRTLWMKVTVFELEKIVKEEYMCKPIPNNYPLEVKKKKKRKRKQ